MSSKQIVGLRRASQIAGVSRVAVGNWCEKYGIGTMVDGVWHIDRAALMKIVRARLVLGRGVG